MNEDIGHNGLIDIFSESQKIANIISIKFSDCECGNIKSAGQHRVIFLIIRHFFTRFF